MRMRINRMKKLLLIAPSVFAIISVCFCVLLYVMYSRQTAETAEVKEELATVNSTQTEILSRLDELAPDAATDAGEISAKEAGEESVVETYSTADLQRDEWPKRVYLTFDDGPSSNTSKILDILREYGVKGNFFCVGTQNQELKGMYKRILDEGHVLGMHSYSHKYSEIYSSVSAFTEDLDKITMMIYEETGVTPKYYRFPAGSRNSVSNVDIDTLIPVLESRGLKYFDWNVASGDATNPMLPKEKIIENVLGSIEDYEEAMILFHDLGNKISTVEALPSIIEALKERQIPIVLIDDTTTQIKQKNKQ